jgi:anthranilate synthase component 1
VRTEAIRDFSKTDYLAAVARAKEYIMAGDLMQVQIGQRIRKPYVDSPLSLYRALRSLNPSPYMYFYNFGDMQIVGSSPEILVRNETTPDHKKKVTIRPLAGTRPRGATPEQDQQLAAELLADPKEIAEHVMLIDLARNDIGRIADIGSVNVTDKFIIEKYSHVQHIVSNVEGSLKDGMSNLDVLRATFPLRRPQGPSDGNHRRTGTRQARHLRRCLRLSVLRRRNGSCHRHPDRRRQRRHVVRPSRRRHRRRLHPRNGMARDRK